MKVILVQADKDKEYKDEQLIREIEEEVEEAANSKRKKPDSLENYLKPKMQKWEL
jgi:hypothetical protein